MLLICCLFADANLSCVWASFPHVAALRLLRKVVGLKDDFYYRYIIKGDLFKPVVDAYTANGSKYNLLNSAMIELFEFIKEVSYSLYYSVKVVLFSNCSWQEIIICYLVSGGHPVTDLLHHGKPHQGLRQCRLRADVQETASEIWAAAGVSSWQNIFGQVPVLNKFLFFTLYKI